MADKDHNGLGDVDLEGLREAFQNALQEYYGKPKTDKPMADTPAHSAERLADQYQRWCNEHPMGNVWGACYRASMDMYAWTMRHIYESKLTQLIICAQQGYTQGADDEVVRKHCMEILLNNTEYEER